MDKFDIKSPDQGPKVAAGSDTFKLAIKMHHSIAISSFSSEILGDYLKRRFNA